MERYTIRYCWLITICKKHEPVTEPNKEQRPTGTIMVLHGKATKSQSQCPRGHETGTETTRSSKQRSEREEIQHGYSLARFRITNLDNGWER